MVHEDSILGFLRQNCCCVHPGKLLDLTVPPFHLLNGDKRVDFFRNSVTQVVQVLDTQQLLVDVTELQGLFLPLGKE